jgi:ribosomal-protein-serine acetyltransferase
MRPFPIDREHPPRSIHYRGEHRYLQIAPWALEDVDAGTAALEASLPELRAFMPFAHAPITREGRFRVSANFNADWWSGKQYVAALRGARGEIVGGIGLHPRTPSNPKALEIGYWASTPHARQGNVTLGVRMMILLAMDRFGCTRVQVLHDEANVASRGVVERCGFIFEGVVRNVVAAPPEEARRQGYRGTSRDRMYSVVAEDLASLEWIHDVRAHTTLVDALGHEQPLVREAS